MNTANYAMMQFAAPPAGVKPGTPSATAKAAAKGQGDEQPFGQVLQATVHAEGRQNTSHTAGKGRRESVGEETATAAPEQEKVPQDQGTGALQTEQLLPVLQLVTNVPVHTVQHIGAANEQPAGEQQGMLQVENGAILPLGQDKQSQGEQKTITTATAAMKAAEVPQIATAQLTPMASTTATGKAVLPVEHPVSQGKAERRSGDLAAVAAERAARHGELATAATTTAATTTAATTTKTGEKASVHNPQFAELVTDGAGKSGHVPRGLLKKQDGSLEQGESSENRATLAGDQAQPQEVGASERKVFTINDMLLHRGEMSQPLRASVVKSVEDVAETAPRTAEQVTSDDVIGQIVEKARLEQSVQGTRMVIQLKPEHLGEVTVKIAVEGQAVSATFHANNAEVRSMLEAALPQMKQELTQATGLKIEHVGVYAGLGQFMSDSQREQRNPLPEFKSRRNTPDADEEFQQRIEELSAVHRGYSGGGGVDYRV